MTFKERVYTVLLENDFLFLEGIEDVKKYFPKIDDIKFEELINLDPTYAGEDRLGKYGKWILSLYNKGILDDKDFSEIPSTLKLFNDHKKSLPEKDINKFKNLSDLQTVVEPLKDKEVEKSNRQNKKDIRKEGANKIYEDNEFLVIQPLTKEASCFYGANTQWCTAARENNQFDQYNKDGPLYIIINKKTNKKHQVSFVNDELRDENDEIDLTFLASITDGLRKWITSNTQKGDSIEEFLNSPEMSLLQDEKDPKSFEHIIDILKDPRSLIFMENPSYKVQLFAINKLPKLLGFVNSPTEQMKWTAIKSNGQSLKFIKNPTEEMILEALRRVGRAIEHVENPTEEMKEIAVHQNGQSLEFIKNPTELLILKALQRDGRAIRYIDNQTEKMKEIAILNNADAIRYIKDPSDKLKLMAIKKDYWSIQYIQDATEEMKILALSKNLNVISVIDDLSENLQVAVVREDGTLIRYIKNPSKKVQMAAVAENVNALKNIKPEDLLI